MTDPDRSELARQLRNHPRKLQDHVCAVCGQPFQSETKRGTYCSNRCRQHAKYQRQRVGLPQLNTDADSRLPRL